MPFGVYLFQLEQPKPVSRSTTVSEARVFFICEYLRVEAFSNCRARLGPELWYSIRPWEKRWRFSQFVCLENFAQPITAEIRFRSVVVKRKRYWCGLPSTATLPFRCTTLVRSSAWRM